MLKKTSSPLSLAILALAVILSIPSGTLAAEHREIVITIPDNGWPPFIILTDNPKQPVGIMIDVFKEIAKAEHYDLQFAPYPEKRGPYMLQSGLVDTFPKAKEWTQNPSDYIWTGPIVDSSDVVISRRTNPIHYRTPEDLAGVSVGLMFSYKYPKLDPLLNRKMIVAHRARSVYNLLRMVCHGHIDCAVVNPLVARWFIRNNADLNLNDYYFNETLLDSAPMRFGFAKKDRWKTFVARFNERLAEMKMSGRLNEIIALYQ